MRRTILLLASMALAVLLAGGVALAATINCPNRAGSLCVGTDNRDTMYGTSAKDVMRGLGAADTLRARAGADRITGGDGADKLGGGDGSDVYAFRNGWGRRDRITSRESAGVDTLDFTALNRDLVQVTLLGGQDYPEVRATHGSGISASIEIPAEVLLENVRGTSQRDYITGNNSSNHLWGYSDNDAIIGGAGNDILDGGAGNDSLYGYGLQGADGSHSTLTGGPGKDRLYGEDGDDTINAIDGEVDEIVCGNGIDTVHYDSGRDGFYDPSTDDFSILPQPSCETTLTT